MKRLLCFLALGVACSGIQAQSLERSHDWYALPLDELVRVQIPPQADVGSRDGAHSARDASVPIDVYSAEQLLAVGHSSLAQALAALVPGFNYPRPSIADGTDHAPPFTLRSLNPDQVLVLVNGKRQQQGALLHTNGTIGRGSSSVDLNSIALLAVERVEVLRDGAAAQYGSDAIAGIINIVLKGYGQANLAQLSWGRSSAGDGLQRQASLFHSTPLTGDGFINLSAELRDRGPTNRAGPDPLDAGRINTHFGDADTQDALLAWNAELPRGDTSLYAHGQFNRRHSSANAYFRRADDDRNLPQIYPQGFLPRIEPRITSLSATLGAKGLWSNASRWGLSYTGGFNDFHFYVANSLNRSLGLATPSNFDSGSNFLAQHSVNADFSHDFHGHNLSGGYEYRLEHYRIRPGELASYQLGPESSWYPGAQGFGGFAPDNKVNAQRQSHALYLDLKYALAPQLMVNAASRAEHYSDFGATLNGKLALRWQPAEPWLLRTSVSTGFRAPSLAQSHYTSTAMVRDGNDILQYGNYGVDHPVAQALGASALKPERSQHWTLGAVWQASSQLTLSADAFLTDIRNRIMPTGYIAGWNLAQLSPQALAILQQHQVDGTTYFTNAVGTRTRGLDLRLDYQRNLSQGRRWQLNAAWQRAYTRITSINHAPEVLGVGMTDLILDPYTRVTMQAGQPQTAFKLWTQYRTPNYDLALNLNRFGSYYSTWGSTPVKFAARWTLDAQLSYHWNKNTTLTLGATNLLNAKPSEWGQTDDELTGSGKPIPYTQYAPFGYNGAAYYLRWGLRF